LHDEATTDVVGYVDLLQSNLDWAKEHYAVGANCYYTDMNLALSDLKPDFVLHAARAHIEARIMEAFTKAVDAATDPGVGELLSRLCDLYALSTIERERAWFLEHNRLTPTRSKSLTATVNDLCRQIRPYAGLLVDAFAIPDELIVAPIARR
jgi:acyl-CoA oxidase